MKRFLLRTLAFAIAAGIIFIGFWNLLAYTRTYLLKTPHHILFLGNSTFQYGIDDSLIPNSLNMGLNGDHVEYMYAKLKLLKKYNPQIDTVYIDLDNIIIAKDLRSEHGSELMHPYYFDCYSSAEIANAYHYSSFKWFTSYLAKPFSIIKIIIPISSFAKNYSIQDVGIGRYSLLERDELQTEIAKFRQNPNKGEVEWEITPKDETDQEFTIYFYNKILEFCMSENITPIFLTMPQYPLAPSYHYRRFHQRHFSNIQLLDFQDLLLPDSLWSDAVHLNSKGAHQFTRILESSIHPHTHDKNDPND